MKLDLKQGEHIRISHDNKDGTFSIWISEGKLHIRANSPDESTTMVMSDSDTPVTHGYMPA